MTPTTGPKAPRHLTRTVLAVGVLCALIAASVTILQHFIVAGLWAVVIVVSTWPGMLWLQRRLGGRRWVAVTLLTLGLLLLLVIPVTLAITAAVVNADEIAQRVKQLSTLTLPNPPAWVEALPVVGANVSAVWKQVASAGVEGLLSRLAPYAGAVTKGFLTRASGIGFILLECMLALAFAALLYARGESAASLVQRTGRRLAGPTGTDAVTLATQVIRGIALGVAGTAVVQSVLSGIGLAIAGVPFAALLTAVTFVSCIAQIGTPIVMVPAVIWVYYTGETGWATFLLIWSLVTGAADNVLRPLLIQRGVDLPFWLVFTGVVGGLLAFGLVGLFIGPVVLAVASMLLTRWLDTGEADGELNGDAAGAASEPRAPAAP